MSRTALIALLCLPLLACAAAPPAPLPLTELARGAYGRTTERSREVVRDPATWERRWAGLEGTGTAPAVDFASQMVIVATMGERRTGGHAIEIVAVEVAETELIVTVRETAPAPGMPTTQALTAPYHAVRVARTTLPVRWVELR